MFTDHDIRECRISLNVTEILLGSIIFLPKWITLYRYFQMASTYKKTYLLINSLPYSGHVNHWFRTYWTAKPGYQYSEAVILSHLLVSPVMRTSRNKYMQRRVWITCRVLSSHGNTRSAWYAHISLLLYLSESRRDTVY